LGKPVSLSHWIAPPGPVADGLTIGLLGGSFNPAHDGHLYVSDTAIRRLKLDYVWWLVSPQNPLKSANGMAAFALRLERARQLAASHPRLVVTGLERGLGTRFTVDTVRALQRRFPQVRFVWLMGSDNLVQFSRWRNWQQIARHIPIAVVQRPGTIMAALNAAAARRFGTVRGVALRPPKLTVLDGVRNPQSATRLRALGANGEAVLDRQHQSEDES
jgi:nicotinate-nucleotide adenylyltransferase